MFKNFLMWLLGLLLIASAIGYIIGFIDGAGVL